MSRFPRTLGLLSAGILLAGAVTADGIKEVRKTLPLARDGRVSIDTFKGSITVSTAEADEVSIDARIEPDGDEPNQRKKVRETEVRIQGGSGSVAIKSDYSGVHRRGFLGIFGDRTVPFVHYTIRIPATARLEIEDYKSTTRVAGLRGDLRIHTYKGSVDLARQDGGVEIETYKGEVSVAYARFDRPARFDTYKGEVVVSLPEGSRFELDADMGRHGDFSTDFEVPVRTTRRHDHESIRGAINGGGPKLSFSTYKGSLRLKR